MLKLTVFAMVAVAVVLGAPRPGDDHYKSRLDNINVDDVLKNNRLIDNYVKCALDKGKCTPEGKDIKEQIIGLLPEILETNCAKCTDDQRTKSRKILRHLHDNKRASYDELLDKYDANKELRTKYKEKYAGLAKDEGFGDIFD